MNLREINDIHNEVALRFARNNPSIKFESAIEVRSFIWLTIKFSDGRTVKYPIHAITKEFLRDSIDEIFIKAFQK